MKLFTVLGLGLGMVGCVWAGAEGNMVIEFPGFLRARADTNLQAFSSALGGISAEPITTTSDPKRPFAVGSDTFTDYESAAVRTCNNQKNACANLANGDKSDNPSGISVDDCDQQETKCTNNASTVNPSTIAAAAVSTSQTKSSTTTSTTTSASPLATTSVVASVVASTVASTELVQPTLHSSDEGFFYFCDP